MNITDEEYKPDDIIVLRWGCEQTNIEFYKIKRRKFDWLTIIPLHCTVVKNDSMQMTGKVLPGEECKIGDPALGWPESKFNGKPIRRKLLRDREGKVFGIKIKNRFGSLWSGKSVNFSYYA